MAVKFFQRLYPFIFKVDHFEGFLNWCKTDVIVNDNSSSCIAIKN